MATIPDWLLGRHLTAVTITPQTEGAGGVLTAVTASSAVLTTTIDSIRLAQNPVTSNISAVNNQRANNVIEEDDGSLVVTQILRKGDTSATPTNLLGVLAMGWDYFSATFTRGGRTWTGIYVRGPYTDGVASKGKNVAEMTFLQADAGTSTLTYT
jgi:hypothetical protein